MSNPLTLGGVIGGGVVGAMVGGPVGAVAGSVTGLAGSELFTHILVKERESQQITKQSKLVATSEQSEMAVFQQSILESVTLHNTMASVSYSFRH